MACLVSLDLADILNENFLISGSFPTQFRIHINDGMYAYSKVAVYKLTFSSYDVYMNWYDVAECVTTSVSFLY